MLTVSARFRVSVITIKNERVLCHNAVYVGNKHLSGRNIITAQVENNTMWASVSVDLLIAINCFNYVTFSWGENSNSRCFLSETWAETPHLLLLI